MVAYKHWLNIYLFLFYIFNIYLINDISYFETCYDTYTNIYIIIEYTYKTLQFNYNIMYQIFLKSNHFNKCNFLNW